MSQRFAKWLAEQIRREGTNMTSLASALGLSHTSVRKWLAGVTEPKRKNCQRLAQVLHVDITEVYDALGIPLRQELPSDVRRIVLKYLALDRNRRARLERYIDFELEDQQKYQRAEEPQEIA